PPPPLHAALPISEPPREPDGPKAIPARIASERQTRHPDRRAHGRAEEPGERRECEDVRRPTEGIAAVREPRHEPGAEEPFERVPAGDGERRPHRARRGGVHQERPQEAPGPDT